jgi:hypothetical protein
MLLSNIVSLPKLIDVEEWCLPPIYSMHLSSHSLDGIQECIVCHEWCWGFQIPLHKRLIDKRYVLLPSMGIEPTTLGLLDPRSKQLSYEGWNLGQKGSNFQLRPICHKYNTFQHKRPYLRACTHLQKTCHEQRIERGWTKCNNTLTRIRKIPWWMCPFLCWALLSLSSTLLQATY